MAEVFTIGTASTRISLLNTSGFYVKEGWRPKASEIDDIWQESALADYRQLAAYRDLTVIETIPLALFATSQDNAATLTQSLRRMLRTARNYWVTTWEDDLVYIQLQGSSETSARYAIVHAGRLPEDEATMSCWMEETGAATMPEMTLMVERGPWLENAPGTGTAVAISALETYDGRDLGNVECDGTREPTTAANAVYIANKRNTANLTDIYYWDDSAGSWSNNQMDDADCSFGLLPGTPEVDDFVIFGIDTSVANSGPFCSLVFDLVSGLTAGNTLEWRYRSSVNADTVDPSTWTALQVQDNTNASGAMTGSAFDTTGIHSVHWKHPGDWQTADPDPTGADAIGVTGYWVACYISVEGAGPNVTPVQHDRPIYTVTWPYTELQSTVTGGDLAALARIQMTNWSDADYSAGYAGGEPVTPASTVYCGLRSVGRGSDFTAYINLADEQNPTGITIHDRAARNNNFDDDIEYSPTGRCWHWQPGGPLVASQQIGDIEFTTAMFSHYQGVFRAFIRTFQQGGEAGDVYVQLRLEQPSNVATFYYLGEIGYSRIANVQHIIDLGQVTLPIGVMGASYETPVLNVYAYSGNAAVTDVYFYDLILIPVDEWAATFVTTLTGGAGELGGDRSGGVRYYLDVDSISYPKTGTYAVVRENANDYVRYPWQIIASGPAMLQNATQQRLWFLADDDIYLGDCTYASSHSLQIWRANRYESLRGSG